MVQISADEYAIEEYRRCYCIKTGPCSLKGLYHVVLSVVRAREVGIEVERESGPRDISGFGYIQIGAGDGS